MMTEETVAALVRGLKIRKGHPEMVANLVRIAAFDTVDYQLLQVMIAASKNTRIDLMGIAAHFPPRVVDLVDWMTDKTTPLDGNRSQRKALERERWAEAPAEAQTIKLADAFENAQDIRAHDPGFANVYLAEMRRLPVLNKGNDRLRGMLERVLS